ncbi:MAG: TlpA disulfide reductase family protein [Breznakibacter sp.]
MRKINVKERWKKYVARKSRMALAFDMLFFVLLILLLFPVSRRWITTTVTRYTMFPPREMGDVYYVGSAVYDWMLVGLDGDTLKMSTQKGQILFVNFWATWCPPCVAEFPAIQRLYDSFGDKVKFILVSDEPSGIVARFMEENEYRMPVYRSIGAVPSDLGSTALPTTFIVTKDGRMAVRKVGSARWDALKVRRLLRDLLGDR